MELTKTPHDHFFTQVMSRKSVACAFFARFLPESIRHKADLTQLEPLESKHISDKGVALYNDALFKCPLGGGQEAYLFAMFEHQRTLEKNMCFRFLKYSTATFEDCLKQELVHLPVMVHFLLYNGSKPWPYSTAFVDYYADPVLGAQFFYMAPFVLINLPEYLPEQIHSDQELGFCFGAFYASTTTDPYRTFADFMNVPIFEEHVKKLPIDLKNIVAAYLGHCVDRSVHSLNDVVQLVTDNQQEKNTVMTSIAQTYQQQGMQQGMQQGIQKGMQQEKVSIARSMLIDRTPLEQVSKWTGLSNEELKLLS